MTTRRYEVTGEVVIRFTEQVFAQSPENAVDWVRAMKKTRFAGMPDVRIHVGQVNWNEAKPPEGRGECHYYPEPE